MSVEQGLTIPVAGGLDKTSPSFELFKTPGAATRLLNFESSIYGGYRRVNGYRKFVQSGVTSVTISDGGAGYDPDTQIVFADDELDGSGAVASLTIDGNGTITAVTVTNAGSGYSVPPTVVLTSTGSNVTTPAVLVANINSATQPSGVDDPLQAIHAFGEGGFAFQSGNIYWSEDGVNWTQVNKDYGTPSSGNTTTQYDTEIANHEWTPDWATAAQLAASGITVSLDDDARYMITEFTPSATDETRIIATNGVDPIVYLETKVESGVRYFKFHRALYESFGVSRNPSNYDDIPTPKYCTTHEDHLIVSGWDNNPGTFYYSALYDDYDFTAASAGEITITDTINGIKPFRKDLIIFGRNTISKLVNINNANIALEDVTKNIGCLDGYSIQEIGGDLVFLAPDGIRTVAATTRIGDIELSSISSKIQPIILDIVKNISSYNLISSVIRSKNQYRLFYTQAGTGAAAQRGITGTFKIGPTGAPVWEWSELIGFNVACYTSNFGSDNIERQYHGSYNGYVYEHDAGNSFDGDKVRAEFKTPDIDYGDVGVRKTLHYLKLSFRPEGDSDIKIDVTFDFDDAAVPRLQLGTVSVPPSVFGTAKFAATIFGGASVPAKKINLLGSGYSNSFKFYSNDTNPPYSIQGMYVDLIPAGRR
jgi:hypothetical protein